MTSHDLADAMRSFDDAVQQRERAKAERVLDEDFALVLVHRAPATMPRARWLEVLQDCVVHSYSVQEQRIDRSGDVASGPQQGSHAGHCAGRGPERIVCDQ